MGFPFELEERRVEQAERIHVRVGKTLDRPSEVERVSTFVDERAFATSLTTGIDRLLGDRDVDLIERFLEPWRLGSQSGVAG